MIGFIVGAVIGAIVGFITATFLIGGKNDGV